MRISDLPNFVTITIGNPDNGVFAVKDETGALRYVFGGGYVPVEDLRAGWSPVHPVLVDTEDQTETLPDVPLPTSYQLAAPYSMVVLLEGRVLAIKGLDNLWRYVDTLELVGDDVFQDSDVYIDPPRLNNSPQQTSRGMRYGQMVVGNRRVGNTFLD